MNMKKLLLLLIIILIILSCCLLRIKKNTPKPNELVFWTLQLGTFSEYIEPIISDFEKKHPEIKILWVDIPYSEGGKRTLAAILSDNPPDLINATPDFSTLLAQKNTLYKFKKDEVIQYIPSVMESLTINNGEDYYALPFYATTAVTMYNKKLVRKSGINKLPSSYEQMYKYAQATLKSANAYVTMPTINENDTFLKILNKYDLASPRKINSKETVELVNRYKDLYKNGLIPKEALTQTHRESLEKYMSGQIVFYNGGANFINLVKENAPDVYKETDVTYQITGKNGKYDFSLMNLIIPDNAQNKELAKEFAILLTNKENQLKFAKMTTVMPVNKEAIEDEYFKDSGQNDLNSKARSLSAKQLKNTLIPIKTKNQKDLTGILNKTIAEIILEKIDTQKGLDDLKEWWERNE